MESVSVLLTYDELAEIISALEEQIDKEESLAMNLDREDVISVLDEMAKERRKLVSRLRRHFEDES